jgi:hypothetical protein
MLSPVAVGDHILQVSHSVSDQIQNLLLHRPKQNLGGEGASHR